jgi:hypothetical protein
MKLHHYVLCLFMCLPSLSFSQTIVATEIHDVPVESAVVHVNAKCLKHFSHQFKNAAETRWMKNDEGFSAHFSETNILYDVRYNHHGRWICTIKNIPVELLSKNVVNVLRYEYRHYNIFFAQQILVPAGSVYLLKIEKGNEWKYVKVSDRIVEVLNEYVKG